MKTRSAAPMVSRCLHAQCPDLFDPAREQPAEAVVPPGLRYGGGDDLVSTAPALREEEMGAGDEAVTW